jgi:shikimate dehydrogenase
MSPRFQSAALAAAGIDLRYERRETTATQLDGVLADCAARGLGGNVTMPLKEAVAARAGRLSRVAACVGAVNTFWFEEGELVGHNTDVDGVLATLGALLPADSRGPVLVLGAGGAAAAVLVALALRGIERITIVARTPRRAAAVLGRTQAHAAADVVVLAPDDTRVSAALGEAVLVINCTPVGMRDDALPVPVEALSDATAVFDLVYRREATAFVQAASARGLPAEDGLRMLVEQGAAAFACWFGIEPSRAVMWHALGATMPASDRPRA